MSQILRKIPKWYELSSCSEGHSTPKPDVTFKWKLFCQDFSGFYALRQHKNTQRGFPIKTTNVGPDDIINEVDEANSK